MFNIIFFLLIGFIAGTIDSSIGMAYGITCTTLLLTYGFTPAIASSTTHYSEIFLTFTSGLSHFKFGNIDKKLFFELMIFGSIFAIIGAYLLSNIKIPYLNLFVTLYLLLMGGIVILRSFQKNIVFKRVNTKALASIGGLFDALGGGGWGPIVSSTLIANGYDVKKTIGTVNLSEFFVTLSQSITFLLFIGIKYPLAIIGILLGGIPSAVIGAYITKKVNHKYLMFIVGIILLLINLIRLVQFINVIH